MVYVLHCVHVNLSRMLLSMLFCTNEHSHTLLTASLAVAVYGDGDVGQLDAEHAADVDFCPRCFFADLICQFHCLTPRISDMLLGFQLGIRGLFKSGGPKPCRALNPELLTPSHEP